MSGPKVIADRQYVRTPGPTPGLSEAEVRKLLRLLFRDKSRRVVRREVREAIRTAEPGSVELARRENWLTRNLAK